MEFITEDERKGMSIGVTDLGPGALVSGRAEPLFRILAHLCLLSCFPKDSERREQRRQGKGPEGRTQGDSEGGGPSLLEGQNSQKIAKEE